MLDIIDTINTKTIKAKDKNIFILLIVVELLFSLLFVFKEGNIELLIAIYFLTAFLLAISFPSLLVYILIFYMSILPSYSNYLRHPFFFSYLSLPIFIALISLTALVFGIEFVFTDKKKPYNFSAIDYSLILFISWLILSSLHGLSNGLSFKIVLRDFFFPALYLFYFIVYLKNWSEERIFRFWDFLVIITILISFEYIYVAMVESSFIKFFLKRIATQQPHLAQFTFPIALSLLLFNGKSGEKILAIISLPLILSLIFLSQQRGLWISVVFSILVLLVFYIFKDKDSEKRLKRFLGFIIVISILSIFMIIMLAKLFERSPVLTLIFRFESIFHPSKDISAIIRFGEIARALHQWEQNILLGSGLGATINPITLSHYSPYLVDNSFIYLLWKTGLIGLGLFLFFMISSIKMGIDAYKITNKIRTKGLIAALVSGLIGLNIVAMTNTSIILYRFVIVWAIAIASLKIIYNQNK